MRFATQFRILPDLPPGNESYLDFFRAVLWWTRSKGSPQEEDLVNWLVLSFKQNLTASRNYMIVFRRLSLLHKNNKGDIESTSFGGQFLIGNREEWIGVLAGLFAESCVGVTDLLDVYARRSKPVVSNEVIKKLNSQAIDIGNDQQIHGRIRFLVELGCLEQIDIQSFEITALGKNIVSQVAAQRSLNLLSEFLPINNLEQLKLTRLETSDQRCQHIIREVSEAVRDSGSPHRLEKAVATVFRFLGYEVEHLGKPGETDVLVHADLGSETYRVIVDTKSRRENKLASLDTYTLQEHMKKYNANYGVVVAGSFAEGKIIRQALEHEIVFFGIPLLVEWIQRHSIAPLNLRKYRRMFIEPGVRTGFPTELHDAFLDRERYIQLTQDFVDTIRELYRRGWSNTLSLEQMHSSIMMHKKQTNYSFEEIENLCRLLGHPVIGALELDSNHLILAVNLKTLSRIFGTISERLTSH